LFLAVKMRPQPLGLRSVSKEVGAYSPGEGEQRLCYAHCKRLKATLLTKKEAPTSLLRVSGPRKQMTGSSNASPATRLCRSHEAFGTRKGPIDRGQSNYQGGGPTRRGQLATAGPRFDAVVNRTQPYIRRRTSRLFDRFSSVSRYHRDVFRRAGPVKRP
jgi:hypothetical protein